MSKQIEKVFRQVAHEDIYKYTRTKSNLLAIKL